MLQRIEHRDCGKDFSPDTSWHDRASRLTPFPSLHSIATASRRARQNGMVALEFALMMIFGLLPLLWITFTGVMIFAANQTLTLAAAEGARAALRYQESDELRRSAAIAAAHSSMSWLLEFSGASDEDSIVVTSVPFPQCEGESAGAVCITVTTKYNYREHPLGLGTGWSLEWLQSSATMQIVAGT